MRAHAECTGTVAVPLPAERALPLFTPEGERGWVDGWSPAYPVGGRPEPSPGLAFVTGSGREERTWIVTDYDAPAGRAAYAYVLPGERVATVEVEVGARADGARARVTYRVTSLSADGDAAVREFEEGYPAMLRQWEDAIVRHVTGGEGP